VNEANTAAKAAKSMECRFDWLSVALKQQSVDRRCSIYRFPPEVTNLRGPNLYQFMDYNRPILQIILLQIAPFIILI
jgi:hypothetical protein